MNVQLSGNFFSKTACLNPAGFISDLSSKYILQEYVCQTVILRHPSKNLSLPFGQVSILLKYQARLLMRFLYS